MCPQPTSRFYKHTLIVIILLVVVHVGCFVASSLLLDMEKRNIDEVDEAGLASIAMHRMVIDCRCAALVCGDFATAALCCHARP